MLIVIGTLAASVSFGTLVVSNIQRSKLSAFSMEAYYEAESGIEQALYQIRKERIYPDNNILPACISGCERNVSYSSQAIIPPIKKDAVAQLDIFDSTGEIEAGVSRLEILCSPSTPPVWLDITFLPVTKQSSNWIVDPANTGKRLKPCDGSTIVVTEFETDKSYVVRIKSLYGNSPQLTVTAFDKDAQGSEVDIATKLKIQAIGSSQTGDIEQKIIVDMPLRSPLAAFYDYVLFSEETIRKVYDDPLTY